MKQARYTGQIVYRGLNDKIVLKPNEIVELTNEFYGHEKNIMLVKLPHRRQGHRGNTMRGQRYWFVLVSDLELIRT